MKSMFLNNHQGNSRFDNYFRVCIGDCTDIQKITEILRIEQYFQVFTGDFNNCKKNMENSRIERYFQVFTGDFNDFQQNHGKFKD
jgi:ribosomal protein S17E